MTASPAGAPRFLTLPGRHGAAAGHWLTRWEARHGMHRVEQSDWARPRRGDWMARLDEVLLDDGDRPAVLVAHGLGCHLVAAWAAHSRLTARVRAALLVAPSDTGRPDAPHGAGWRPAAARALPFASAVVASIDDPNCSVEHACALAGRWDSDCIVAGAAGGLDEASALGDWPAGRGLLGALLRRAADPASDAGAPPDDLPPAAACPAAPTTTP